MGLIAVVPVQEEEADLQAADVVAVGYYPESYFDVLLGPVGVRPKGEVWLVRFHTRKMKKVLGSGRGCRELLLG